jgi:hypothetical protein
MPKKADSESPAAADTRTAKIRTLRPKVKARGFTLGARQVVEGVPLAHAEYLRDQGDAEILEVL